MANTKSAKKSILVNRRNRLKNIAHMSEMRNIIKRVSEALQSASEDQESLLKFAQKKIAQKAQKGIIKKNKAARIISSLYRLFNQEDVAPVKEAPKKAKKTTAKKVATKKTTAAKKTSSTKKAIPTKKTTTAKKTTTKSTEKVT